MRAAEVAGWLAPFSPYGLHGLVLRTRKTLGVKLSKTQKFVVREVAHLLQELSSWHLPAGFCSTFIDEALGVRYRFDCLELGRLNST